MAKIMEMPKLSDTMKEGIVARWQKKEGEKVQAGLPIVEIETDKATMEYESPSSGILLKILVPDQGTCALAAPIAVIGKEGEDWQKALQEFEQKREQKNTASKELSGKQNSASVQPTPSAGTHTVNHSQTEAEKIKASPLAKKVAAEKGINLTTVQGTGPAGRIIVRDLESNAGQRTTAGLPSLSNTKIPLTAMRKTIARRLTESVVQAPHFYLTVRVEMDALLSWRKQILEKSDQKFSVNDMIIWLVSKALKKHPEINSSWQDDHILQHNDVHVGFAVALPAGLMTPVVRHSHQQSVFAIAQQTKNLIQKARDGKLSPDEYTGGTFTISNLGMQGIEEFTAIINPPQAAILAIGATIPSPKLKDDGTWGVAQLMTLTLSCDHRVIDGAMGAEFLKTLKSLCEDPFSIALIC